MESVNYYVPSKETAFDNIGDIKINPGWGVGVTGATLGIVEDIDSLYRFDTCMAHENSD
jgi:hypothetical protein